MLHMRSPLVLGLIASGLIGCAHNKIPLTNIDDTEENREILQIVKEYHKALESLDADAVLSLVSPRYFEDNGNLEAADDYDFDGLRKTLREDFKRTRSMKVNIRVDAIEVDDETEKAWAELYYQIHAQNDYPSGTKWETGSDRTRLRFERVDGRWLIIAGL
jgi:hypothetical protein